MDQTASRERDLAVDLESGGTTSEEDGTRDTITGVNKAKKLLGRVWCGFVSIDGSTKGEEGISPAKYVPDSEEVSRVSVEVLTDAKSEGEETMVLVEKKTLKEKRKKTSSRKAPKPPRPPRGPSLDAADQKLIREISELAMLKRARNERMKALKKTKAAKASSSSNSSLCAMIITVIFCLVIVFQGLCSRSSSTLNSEGSPESAVAIKGSLISIQYYKNPSVNDTSAPDSVSSNLVEQVSGSSPSEEVSRVVE